MTPATLRTRFRALLADPKIRIGPGAFSPFLVPLIEEAGFPFVYATGLGAAASVAGYPDVGLLTLTEMATQVRYLVQRSSLPVFCDADTGYGSAANAARTLREFEDAGAAGLHLEDQDWPKRCGHMAGKAVVPWEEMVGKISAMLDARRDPNFLVIARSDAIAVEGFEAALERGHRYIEAGADGLFFDALRSEEQVATVGRTFGHLPLVFNMSISGLTPSMGPERLEQLGFRIMLFAGGPLLMAHATLRRYLREIAERGSQDAIKSEMTPLQELFRSLGAERYLQ